MTSLCVILYAISYSTLYDILCMLCYILNYILCNSLPFSHPSFRVGACINFVSTGSTTLSTTVTRLLYMFGCTLQLGAAGIRRTRATKRRGQLDTLHLLLRSSGTGRFAACSSRLAQTGPATRTALIWPHCGGLVSPLQTCAASGPSPCPSLTGPRGRAAPSVTAQGVDCAGVLLPARLPFRPSQGRGGRAAHTASQCQGTRRRQSTVRVCCFRPAFASITHRAVRSGRQ